MILDTTFAIDLLRGNRDAERKARELEEGNQAVLVPTPVVLELFVGVVRSDAPASERRKVEEFAGAHGHADLGYGEARMAGEILGELLLKGERIGLIDSMIASIALNRGETILTRNPRHFERIEGLDVQGY
jgi:predicted nucleic acid-binding protein